MILLISMIQNNHKKSMKSYKNQSSDKRIGRIDDNPVNPFILKSLIQTKIANTKKFRTFAADKNI
ncbi:hypothetical protein AGMMS49982_22320 [Bacteroidia bacterium]|nr:hypothetical protein AGMMS49982_22320 [Bacteroidia bacterium]